jgi:hypothetical protein
MSKDPLSDPIDLGIVEAAAEQPPEPAPAPTADELRKADFLRQVMEARNRPAPTPPVALPPSERQMTQTQREITRGQERVQAAADQQRARPPQPAPDPRAGSSTPVFRPSEYQHESKNAVPFKG